MPDLKKRSESTVEVRVPFEDDTEEPLILQVRKHGMRLQELLEVQAWEESDQRDFPRLFDLSARVIARFVASWNLTEDGKPVPLEVEVLKERLDAELLTAIANAVQEVFVPNSEAPGSVTSGTG